MCTVFRARGLRSALEVLEKNAIAVVLCERYLLPGTWIDVLEHIGAFESPPLLVVTSRLADEYLWVEALNRGAWDVLAKPFDPSEVLRAVESAWRRWRDPIRKPAREVAAMKAAS